MPDFSEDCCFNYVRDQCKGHGCPCGCHAETATHVSELEMLRAERAKWHESYMGAVRLAERSGQKADRFREALELIARGTWTAKNSVESIVWTAREALKGER